MTQKSNYQHQTSGASHAINFSDGVYNNQQTLVLKALAKEENAMNSRLLSMRSGLERSAIPRVILNLKSMGLVKEEKEKKPCPYTNRLTIFYTLTSNQESQDGTSN